MRSVQSYVSARNENTGCGMVERGRKKIKNKKINQIKSWQRFRLANRFCVKATEVVCRQQNSILTHERHGSVTEIKGPASTLTEPRQNAA